MKRILALLLVLLITATGYAMFENGGFLTLYKDRYAQESSADSIVLVDTVIVSNASATLLFVPTATLTPPTQFGMIRFASATTTAALRDTTRYISRVGTGPVSDTIALSVALSANSANTDSVIITFYADNGVNTDTVTTVQHYWPYTFAQNMFWSVLDTNTYEDSTGVAVRVQTRFGDYDPWATIASLALDLNSEEGYISLGDSTATVQMGQYFRTLVIYYDSTRGARVNSADVEVVWRGRK